MNPENYIADTKWQSENSPSLPPPSPRARSIRNLINHNINPVLPRSDNSLPDPRIMGKLFN